MFLASSQQAPTPLRFCLMSYLADCPGGGGAATGDEPELAGWVRPATCAAIAVAAIFFFTILYYGKSWADSRTKVGTGQSNIH